MTIDANADLHVGKTPLIMCTCCGRPFALRQDIEDVVKLLRQSGMSEAIADERLRLLQTCTDCKSDRSVHSLCNVEMTLFLQTAKGKMG